MTAKVFLGSSSDQAPILYFLHNEGPITLDVKELSGRTTCSFSRRT
jgi:hypothetical protein